MHYIYRTHDTCAQKIEFDLENNVVTNVAFTGGCSGNLQAIPLLIEGWQAEDVIQRVKEVRCGIRSTSCAGQLAEALSLALSGELRPA